MEKKNVVYFAVISIVVIGFLAGLYFYNRGLMHDLNFKIKLNPTVEASFSKIYIKPKDETKNYVIIYLDVKNNSNQRLDSLKYIDDYGKSENTGKIALRNSKNQVCATNRYYTYMNGIENLDSNMYGGYAAQEVKSGYLVFECLKDDNNFIINYGDQNLEIKY